MNPRRVVILSHAAVVALNQRLYAHLAAFPDLDVQVIAPASWVSSLRGPLVAEALPELAGRVHLLEVKRSGNLHQHTYPRLGETLAALRPDVLLLDEDPPSLVAAQVLKEQARLGFALVAAAKQNVFKRYPPPFCWHERKLLRVAAGLAASSEQCLEVARRKGYDGPAGVIYYPVDTDYFQPAGQPPDRPFTVGFAGRLTPEKGVADLIAALARLQGTGEARLVIVGSGPEAARLQALAGARLAAGSCTLVPSVPHEAMAAQYQALDVLVLPSRTTRGWQEQFGRVLAEAMACGVATVGSATGFIPELITTTGGGLLYPEGDVAALAAALEQLRQEPAQRHALARAGRVGVLAHYSCPVLAERLRSLLRGTRPG